VGDGSFSQRCGALHSGSREPFRIGRPGQGWRREIITKNGESYVALIDSDRLDYYHRLELERIHLLLIEDARRGLADIDAGRTCGADAAIAKLQRRRADRWTGCQEAWLMIATGWNWLGASSSGWMPSKHSWLSRM
jgi:hypothetical protein